MLLLMGTSLCGFFLSLLSKESFPLVQTLARNRWHKTEKWYREAAIPLTRIRAALSALGLVYPARIRHVPRQLTTGVDRLPFCMNNPHNSMDNICIRKKILPLMMKITVDYKTNHCQ